jgi:hypothetical protein
LLRSFETSGVFQTTFNPEGRNVRNHRCGILSSTYRYICWCVRGR